MTQPDPRTSASFARAVDLSGLKRAPSDADGTTSGGSANVVDVTEATFQDEVLNRSLQVPVVLDLWAEWCGPCKQLSPVLEKLAAEGGGAWVLAKIDVDTNPRIAQALGVQGIPAVKAVYQGQLVAEFTGALPEPQVRQWIGQIVQLASGEVPQDADASEYAETDAEAVPEDPRVAAAEDAISRGDYAEATRRYQEILDAEPGHPLATVALRQAELLARVEASAPDAVQRANAAPSDLDAQLVAADVEVATGQPAVAFARLIDVVRRTSGEERNRARTRLVELFAVVGDDDPAVGPARRELASVLF